MEIKLFLNKNVNENANFYFQKAKKLKAKLPGLDKAIQQTQQEITLLDTKQENYLKNKEKKEKLKIHTKQEWYHKFRYTKTPQGLLFVIGKDAGTNETLIKKHLKEDDLVFHTEEPGSPFGILKNAKDKTTKEEIFDCAQFLACFSQQWKKGFGTADVFWVNPNQISKQALSGEYIKKGSFMIYGEKNIIKNIPLKICLGKIKHKIQTDEQTIEYFEPFSGPENFVKHFTPTYIKLEPGETTYKLLNKEIYNKLKIKIDELPKYIPNNCRILKK